MFDHVTRTLPPWPSSSTSCDTGSSDIVLNIKFVIFQRFVLKDFSRRRALRSDAEIYARIRHMYISCISVRSSLALRESVLFEKRVHCMQGKLLFPGRI